jgi:PDZ domain
MWRSPLRTRPALAAVSVLTLISTSATSRVAAQDHDDHGTVRVYAFGRPRIGVTVGIQADKDADKIGARIADVTPDGPADKAGLKEGDIITRFNGVALGGLKADDDDQSGPGQKLVELAHKLDAGDTVQVEYRRGTDSRKATLIAEDLSGMAMRRFRVDGPEMRGMVLPRMEMTPRFFENGPGGNGFSFSLGRDDMGLDLTDLNPELGEYFGAKEGVLVLRTPKDSDMPLRAGNVIVAIDGREPRSESQVRRILRSYDAGETAKIDVLRKQKRLTLTWKVPAHEGTMWQGPSRVRRPAADRS